jgi:hypothetical protein
MHRRRRAAIAPAHVFAFVLALGVAPLVACGLDAVGAQAISDASPNGAPDGAAPSEGEGGGDGDGASPGLPDGDVPEATTIPFDAGEVDAGCNTVTIDDPLSSISPSRWLVTSNGNNAGLPAVVGTTAGDIVKLVTTRGGSRGGLWLANPVPLAAFDVQFTVYGACESTDWWDYSCADGLAAAWLDTTGVSSGLGAALGNAGSGSTLGIPTGLSGAGIAIDYFQNAAPLSDPFVPSLETIAIDGTKPPATYDWTKAAAQHTHLSGYTHTIGLRLRGTTLSVSYDGAPAYAPVTVPATPSGTFGFTAATGGESAVFYVWDFHAVFYDCVP